MNVEYTGDSDSDGFVLDENEDFDASTMGQQNEQLETTQDHPSSGGTFNTVDNTTESRKRERMQGSWYNEGFILETLSKKKQKFAELKV